MLSQLLTNNEAATQGLIGAVIAFCGVVLSTGISLIVALGTKRYNYNQLFAETVSQSRNKWLNEMRSFISAMLAEVKNPSPSSKNGGGTLSQNSAAQAIATERTNEYWKARNQIILRLNVTETLQESLYHEILKLDCVNNSDEEQTIQNIITLSQLLLKDEWEKVKKEAKGE